VLLSKEIRAIKRCKGLLKLPFEIAARGNTKITKIMIISLQQIISRKSFATNHKVIHKYS